MRPNVKPLVHWAIYKGYKIRYTDRSPAQVLGILTTPDGELNFGFDPTHLLITLPEQQIAINQHGWELSQDAERTGQDGALSDPKDQT